MPMKLSIRTSLIATAIFVVTPALVLGSNGCGGEAHVGFPCDPDGGPVKDNPWSCETDDAGIGIDPLSCIARGGACIEMGTADFRQSPVLVWMGAEEEQPACPERAPTTFYEGYKDLSVNVECSKCSCGPSTCIMSKAMKVDPDPFCKGVNAKDYAAPDDWNGSCSSPSVMPPGSFASIKLVPATASPCEPIGDPVPKTPGFAPGPKSFSNGVSWGTFAKACQGTAEGQCKNSADFCVPTAEPPPPGFRQCVQYILPVDENKLPQCPVAFPDQFVFYASYEGKAECSACQCGDPVGSQCVAAFSAYQDSACAGQPMSLFENVPANAGQCIDFAGVPNALGSMQAKWFMNNAGSCEPSGGELIGEVKAADPRLFCCQEPPKPPSK